MKIGDYIKLRNETSLSQTSFCNNYFLDKFDLSFVSLSTDS